MLKSHPETCADYRKSAVECDLLADATDSLGTREIMLHQANLWRALADEDEAQGTPRRNKGGNPMGNAGELRAEAERLLLFTLEVIDDQVLDATQVMIIELERRARIPIGG